MIHEFLHQNFPEETYHSLQLGNLLYTDFEQITKGSMVILSSPDLRGANIQNHSPNHKIIKEFCDLYAGNWSLPIFYIGEIIPGADSQSTHFAVQEVTNYIIQKEAFPIILGGSSEQIYPIFCGLESDSMLNLTSIDSQIRIEEYRDDDSVTENNVLSRILSTEPCHLFHFANLGYQTYKTSYKAIDALQEIHFEAIRLGNLIDSMEEAEPILRASDLVVLNCNSIQTNTLNTTEPNPNGFTSREICAIARYIGISPQIKSIFISNYFEWEGNSMGQLIAQILWYIIEGNNVKLGYKDSESNYVSYTVLQEDKEIVFLKDKIIDRWWIQLGLDYKDNAKRLIPCTYSDYLQAVEGKIPDRFWNNLKKFL